MYPAVLSTVRHVGWADVHASIMCSIDLGIIIEYVLSLHC